MTDSFTPEPGSRRPSSPDDATRFAIGARLNYECATAADEKLGMLPGYEICAPIPVMMLFAFSIELALKSRLLACGKTLSEVKKYSHNLVISFEDVCKLDAAAGKFINLDGQYILKLVSDLHSKDYSLRCYNRPARDEFPTGGSIHGLAMKCLKLCAAPELEDIQIV